MKPAYSKFIKWFPVLMRGLLWIIIAIITEFLLNTKELTREKIATWFWLDYVKLVLTSLLPGFIAWRTYLDQSLSHHIKKQDEKDNPIG